MARFEQLIVILAGIMLTSAASLASTIFAPACNPLRHTCPPNRALSTMQYVDFREGPSPLFLHTHSPRQIVYDGEGLHFMITMPEQLPHVEVPAYLMFGRAEVHLRASSGHGIVSGIALQSDAGDELDFEIRGADELRVQSNYHGKGNFTSADREELHNVTDTQAKFHNYTIDWRPEGTSWYIDGALRRYLPANHAGAAYPQTPMFLRIGLWPAGDSHNDGTVEWAGGRIDYATKPFIMTVREVVLEDYSHGTHYEYTDKSGSWRSINALKGNVTRQPGPPRLPERTRISNRARSIIKPETHDNHLGHTAHEDTSGFGGWAVRVQQAETLLWYLITAAILAR